MKLIESIALGVCAVLAGLASSAEGQDGSIATYWVHDPAEPGRWFNPDNWSAGIPAEWTAAIVDNGGRAVLSGDDGTLGAAARVLMLGGGSSGAVEQVGGTLKLAQSIWLGRYGYRPGYYHLVDGRRHGNN